MGAQKGISISSCGSTEMNITEVHSFHPLSSDSSHDGDRVYNSCDSMQYYAILEVSENEE